MKDPFFSILKPLESLKVKMSVCKMNIDSLPIFGSDTSRIIEKLKDTISPQIVKTQIL